MRDEMRCSAQSAEGQAWLRIGVHRYVSTGRRLISCPYPQEFAGARIQIPSQIEGGTDAISIHI